MQRALLKSANSSTDTRPDLGGNVMNLPRALELEGALTEHYYTGVQKLTDTPITAYRSHRIILLGYV